MNQANPIRVLFQGDSITDAFRKPEEINPAFQLGNGYAFLAAARLAVEFPRKFLFFNRGISGQTVQHLAARWQEDAIDLNPDILSLLVGVNSVIRRSKGQETLPDSEILTTYRSLLIRLRAQNPQVQFLMLEPFLVQTGIGTPEIIADLAPLQAEIAEISDEFSAAFVPLQQIFNDACEKAPADYWAYDGVHPTHAGFELISRAWRDAFADLHTPGLPEGLSRIR